MQRSSNVRQGRRRTPLAGFFRKKDVARLYPWITEASPSLIASFARGITNDKSAVRSTTPPQNISESESEPFFHADPQDAGGTKDWPG